MDESGFLEQKRRRSSEIDIFLRIVEAVANDGRLPPCEELTGFLALVGHNYLPARELMVVGRATNGEWAGKWPLPELRNQEFIDCVVHTSLDPSPSGEPCPMRWVTDTWGLQKALRFGRTYSTARSQFWHAIRGLVCQLGIADVEQDSWPSHLVWSNLYKIGPAAGRNPSSELRRVQQDACASLIKHEIERYRPKRLVFLTGSWVEIFLPRIWTGNEIHQNGSKLVEATGVIDLPSNRIQVVVAKHPQGKKRSDWIGSVMEAFGLSAS